MFLFLFRPLRMVGCLKQQLVFAHFFFLVINFFSTFFPSGITIFNPNSCCWAAIAHNFNYHCACASSLCHNVRFTMNSLICASHMCVRSANLYIICCFHLFCLFSLNQQRTTFIVSIESFRRHNVNDDHARFSFLFIYFTNSFISSIFWPFKWAIHADRVRFLITRKWVSKFHAERKRNQTNRRVMACGRN